MQPTLLESPHVTVDQAYSVSPMPEALVRYVLLLDPTVTEMPRPLGGEILILMTP